MGKDKSPVNIIKEFKNNNLNDKLNAISSSIVNQQSLPDLGNIYKSALEVKKLSTQIDEIVHATGIIQCLGEILMSKEKIESVSLASGAIGDGFDLVTNMRVAEFKFSNWQEKGNGMRKRQVFADLVKLYLYKTSKSKELYVFSTKKVINFLSSKKATWKNVLSKSGGLDLKLEEHLKETKNDGLYLYDVYKVSNVQVFDLDNILKL